jgi:hypothetical protein
MALEQVSDIRKRLPQGQNFVYMGREFQIRIPIDREISYICDLSAILFSVEGLNERFDGG